MTKAIEYLNTEEKENLLTAISKACLMFQLDNQKMFITNKKSISFPLGDKVFFELNELTGKFFDASLEEKETMLRKNPRTFALIASRSGTQELRSQLETLEDFSSFPPYEGFLVQPVYYFSNFLKERLTHQNIKDSHTIQSIFIPLSLDDTKTQTAFLSLLGYTYCSEQYSTDFNIAMDNINNIIEQNKFNTKSRFSSSTLNYIKDFPTVSFNPEQSKTKRNELLQSNFENNILAITELSTKFSYGYSYWNEANQRFDMGTTTLNTNDVKFFSLSEIVKKFPDEILNKLIDTAVGVDQSGRLVVLPLKNPLYHYDFKTETLNDFDRHNPFSEGNFNLVSQAILNAEDKEYNNTYFSIGDLIVHNDPDKGRSICFVIHTSVNWGHSYLDARVVELNLNNEPKFKTHIISATSCEDFRKYSLANHTETKVFLENYQLEVSKAKNAPSSNKPRF